MRQRQRTIALTTAVLVLAALLGFIVLDEKQRGIRDAPVQLLRADDAREIEIILHRADRTETLLLEKKDTEWQLVAPERSAVNQQRITPLLSLLNLPDSTAYRAETVDLDALGLSSPVAVIRINQHTFTFGGPGPGEFQRYLMINQLVFLTRDILLPLVNGGQEALTAGVD